MTASAGTRRTPLVVIGAALAVAGVVAGVLLFVVAPNSRMDAAVESLAPAPIGCETTLEFERAGTYYLFAEIRGSVGPLDGDCENDHREYEYTSRQAPDLDVTLLDDEGDDVGWSSRGRGLTYDRGGSAGEAFGSAVIDEPGTYVLRVDGDEDDDLIVRVGRDPASGTGGLKAAGIGSLAGGIVLGAVLVIVGIRRRPGAPEAAGVGGGVSGWIAPQQPPTGPPTGPPMMEPPQVPRPSPPPGAVPQRPPGPLPPPGSPPSSDDDRQPPSWGPPR